MTIKLPNFRRHFKKRYPISFLYKVSNLIFWCFNLMFFKKNLNLATLKNQNVKDMNYCNTFLKVNAWMFWAAQICSELYYSVNLEIALVLQYWKCQTILWFQPKRGGLSSFTPISVSSLICTSGKEYCSQAGLTKFIDIRTSVHLAHCTMCRLGSIFSFQPNKLRHILKFVSWYIIQHIFVPACSVGRKTWFSRKPWLLNSKFGISGSFWLILSVSKIMFLVLENEKLNKF